MFRLTALTSGVLGLVSWADEWNGRVVRMLLAGLSARTVLHTGRGGSRRLVTVPMGRP